MKRAFSLTTLLRKPWTQDERLSFPRVTLPLALTRSDWSEFGSQAQRRTLFRLGFGLAAAYSAINIAHAFAPWLPALPFSIGLEGISLERPWTPLGAVRAYFMLDAVGIGARMAAQGMDELVKKAIEGFTGSAGVMPAKGGNPALTDEQVKATVEWMVAQSK